MGAYSLIGVLRGVCFCNAAGPEDHKIKKPLLMPHILNFREISKFADYSMTKPSWRKVLQEIARTPATTNNNLVHCNVFPLFVFVLALFKRGYALKHFEVRGSLEQDILSLRAFGSGGRQVLACAFVDF